MTAGPIEAAILPTALAEGDDLRRVASRVFWWLRAALGYLGHPVSSPANIRLKLWMISLKALSYFADGDLPSLPDDMKGRLSREAATEREIPRFDRLSCQIMP